MVKNRMTSPNYTRIVIALLALACSHSFAIEKIKGILRLNQLPTCANRCDAYYLDPDVGIGSINLKGSFSSEYVDKHVEITGNLGTCSGCLTFSVIQISLIVAAVGEQSDKIPNEMRLDQNYPNPFNPTTVIPYTLPADGQVTLKIFDLLGQEVATVVSDREHAGFHRAIWNAVQQSGGVYISQLTFQSSNRLFSRQTRKIVYVR